MDYLVMLEGVDSEHNVLLGAATDEYRVLLGCEPCAPSAINPDFSVWTPVTTATITPNAGPSPGCGNDAVEYFLDDNAASFIYYQEPGAGTPGSSLDFSFWLKRISAAPGTGDDYLRCENALAPGTYGRWNINLDLLSGDWELITSTHPAVTILIPFAFDGSGDFWFQFIRFSSGPITAQLWCGRVVET